MVHPLDTEEACPGCGAYCSLTITAPPMPVHLSEHGTGAQIEAWENSVENILECVGCGWCSDDEGGV